MVQNNLEIYSQVCAASFHLSWDGNWNSQHIWAVILMFLKQSSDNSFSWAVVTFEVAPHQETMCPHGMKVVIYSGFTAYYWARSQWRLSKHRVRRWTWCSSTSTWGSISSTGWTGLIKYVVQEMAGYCSLKPSLLSVMDSTLLFTLVCKGENGKVNGAGRIFTKFEGEKMFLLSELKWHGGENKLDNIPFPTPSIVILSVYFSTPRCSMKFTRCSCVPPTNRLLNFWMALQTERLLKQAVSTNLALN